MPSLLKRFFDGIASWSRRREEREREFVAANASWTSAAAAQQSHRAPLSTSIDREGLQAAFLDQSGRIVYYLDTKTGEVVERRDGAVLPPPRFRRVPSRAAGADEADRRAFIESLEPSPARDRLADVSTAVDFRAALSGDRTLERRWYVFRNDRALAAIEEWLASA